MWVMFNRVLTAVWAVAVTICISIPPAQSASRGGVANGFHTVGGFPRPFVPARSFAPAHVAVPLAAVPGHIVMRPRIAVPPGVGRNMLSARGAFARHHRGHSFDGLSYASAILGGLYGSYDDPSDYTYYDPTDVAGLLPPTGYPVPDAAPYARPVEHFGCTSQIVSVPSSTGGEANVTITRC